MHEIITSHYTLIILAIINVITFLIYAVDKFLAIKQMRRISEKTLFLLALCFGSIGAVCAMFLTRHKIKKPRFYLVIVAIILLQAVTLYFAYTSFI